MLDPVQPLEYETDLLAAPLGFFRGFWPRFRVHRFKSARPYA